MEKRELKTTTRQTFKTTFNDWKLNFIIETAEDSIDSIQVNGNKNENYFSANRNGSGQFSSSFSKSIDSQLLNEVILEIQNIETEFGSTQTQ